MKINFLSLLIVNACIVQFASNINICTVHPFIHHLPRQTVHWPVLFQWPPRPAAIDSSTRGLDHDKHYGLFHFTLTTSYYSRYDNFTDIQTDSLSEFCTG